MKYGDLSVLICDDSMFARKNLCMFLATLGVSGVYEAADGSQAVDQYKEKKPDLVFMDIVMPVVTGIDALKQIKETDPDAKVIMASSIGTQNYLKEAIRAGAADFLQKPIANDDVKRIIDNYMKGEL